ncbi:MAG: class I SAM-dependent methyltransferase [Candidatus Altiarchaeota archaeon]|nr:class I SAM-dependent methyltransferase [Candidatus Altiarchaeota archaeon]
MGSKEKRTEFGSKISKRQFGIIDYDDYWDWREKSGRYRKTAIHRKIEEMVKGVVPKGAKILDLGVGPGIVYKDLLPGYRVFGVEISKNIFDRYDFDRTNIKLWDLNKGIPKFGVKRFDLIIMSMLLHHLDDPLKLLKEAKAMMDMESYILCGVPNITYYKFRVKYLFGGKFPDISHSHKNFLTPADYNNLFEAAGLEVVEVQTYKKFIPSRILKECLGSKIFYLLKKLD